MERLHFPDWDWAIDVEGNAGTTVKILGAVFGAEYAQDPEFVGIGLALLDAGMSYADLMDLAWKRDWTRPTRPTRWS